MKVTESLLRYSYEVLKATAFHDIPVPRCKFEVSKLRKAWGYYYDEPRKIQIAASIDNPQRLLMVMAHEMCHAALDKAGCVQHNEHDDSFRTLAEVVCNRMGWSLKEF